MRFVLRLVLCTCLIFLYGLKAFPSPIPNRNPTSHAGQPGGFKDAAVAWTTTSTMLLQWSDSLQGVTGYSVYGSVNKTVFNWYADISPDTSSYSALHLANNTRYYWMIIAHSATGADTSLILSDSTHCNMSGTFSVGPTGYFHSIGNALDSLPLKGMTGSVVLELQPDYIIAADSFPLVFPGNIPCRQQDYSLTLRPAAGTSGLTLKNTGSSPLFILDNTFNVTIDGRPGGAGTLQGLTLSGLGPIIDCRNSSNNTFTYLVIQAAFPNPAGSLITLEGTAAPGSNNNSISWCDVSGLTSYVTRPHTLVYSSASAGITNSNNQILNSNLHDFSAVGVFLASGNDGWVIRNNSFYGVYGFYADSTAAGMIGITDATHAGMDSISGNYFGGTAPQCGGTVLNAIFTDTFQVISAAGNVDIRNNIIQRIAFTKLSPPGHFYPAVNLISVNGEYPSLQQTQTISNNTLGGAAAADSLSVLDQSTIGLPVTLILGQSTGGSLTVSANKMQNIWLRSTGSAGVGLTGIYTSTPNNTITNNIIGDAGGAPGIAHFTTGNIFGISDNSSYKVQIKNNALTGWNSQGVLTGISTTNPMGVGGGSTNISQNTIGGLTTSFTDPGGNTAYRIAGIITNQAWGSLITGNTFSALKAPSGIVGIWSGAGDPTEHIDGNFIHPVKGGGAGDSVLNTTVTGIYLIGDQSLVQNNMIKLGPDSAATPIRDQASFYGIYADQGSFNEIRHNSIYIDGKGVLAGLNNSACISLFTMSAVHAYNNIFVNRRSAAVAGNSSFHYIIWNTSGGISSFDHNIYYFDGTNSSMASYYGYVNNFARLNDWRVQTGFDLHSIFADPGFSNPGGSSAFVDLHLASRTPAEAKGDSAHSAITDFDGQLRSTLTPVDIGADAGNFTLRDAWPPILTPDSIPDEQQGTPEVITVGMTDDSGVDSTVGSAPAMWFRKFSPLPGNWYHVTGSLHSGSAKQGVWKFTADYSTFGLPVNAGDSFQCYFVAQDTTSLHNIGFAPLQNANHTHPDLQDTLPTTVYKYKVRGVLPDTLWVGAGQPYTSLTNAGGAFQALNTASASVHGAVIVITSDLAESGTYGLIGYRDSSGNAPLQIITNTPVLKTIANNRGISVPVPILIQFTKSRDIEINGAVNNTGRFLKFVNTMIGSTTTTQCLFFGDSVTGITIRHAIIGADDNGTYSNFVSAIGIGFDWHTGNVTIDSNLIGNGTAGNTTTVGIYSAFGVTGVSITNNEFFNFNRSGIEFTLVGDSCVIQNNHFYDNEPRIGSFQYRSGINVNAFIGAGASPTGGHIISGNYIGGSGPFCAGSPWIYNAANTSLYTAFQGIGIQSSLTRTSYVYNNVIANINISPSSSASFYGIAANGNVDIGSRGGNIIGNPAVAGDITNAGSFPGAGLYTEGIRVSDASSAKIVNNRISNLSAPGSGNMSVAGISCEFDAGSGGTITVRNDTIRQLSSGGTLNPNNLSYPTPFSVGGIVLQHGLNSGFIVGHNDIASLQSTSPTATLTAGILDLSMKCPVTISRNRVRDLVNLASAGGEIAGISVTGNAHMVINNQVSLTNGGYANALLISGIKDWTTGTNGLQLPSRYYYNSVFLGGSASSGNTNSYAANFQTNAPVGGFRDNLLYNARSGGTGAQLALGINMPTNIAQLWPPAASDFNVLVTRDTSAIVGWQGTNMLNLTTLRSLSGADLSSFALSISALPAGSLFVDTAGGNLDINVANPLCWTLNGKGIPIGNITGDFDSGANVRSQAIATGATDIGSDEFTPLVAPPAMVIQGSHQQGGSDTLSVNGRNLAVISWGNTGVLPTLGSAYWNSGVWPNDTTNNGQAFLARYLNGFWTIPATGGNGYDYSITFFYDSAMLGKITTLAGMVINKREPNVPGSWVRLPGTVDTVRRTVTAANLTTFSEFTITDSLADLATGMPAPDLAITGLHPDSAHAGSGSSIEVKFTVTNLGTAPAPTDTVYFYLSPDSTHKPGSPGTILLATYPVTGSLAAGASSSQENAPVAIPCATTPGGYYLFAQADGGHQIIQRGNDDHAASTALGVTTGPPAPGKPPVDASPSLSACSPDSVILSTDSAMCPSCSYTWSNGATGGSDIVKTSGIYSVSARTVCGVAVSDSVTITITPPSIPSVSLSYTGCDSTALTFVARAVNGGAHPVFQWNVNNVPASSTTDTLVLSRPVNGSRISCIMTSDAACVQPASASDSLEVQCGAGSSSGITGLAFLQAAPNPTRGPVAIHLRLDQVKNVGYKLLDNAGRTVLSLAPAPMFGDQTLTADLSHLTSGIYYIRLSFDGQPVVLKILVVR